MYVITGIYASFEILFSLCSELKSTTLRADYFGAQQRPVYCEVCLMFASSKFIDFGVLLVSK